MGLLGSTEEEIHDNLRQQEAGAATSGSLVYNPQPPSYPPPPSSHDYIEKVAATYATAPVAPSAPSPVASSVPATVPAAAPVALATPVFRRGEWSSGLITGLCGDPGGVHSFMLGTCCPCLLFGMIYDKLAPDEVPCGGSFAGGCVAFYLLGGCISQWNTFFCLLTTPLSCTFLAHTFARTAIRKRFGIRGSECGDCCVVFFCTPCALVQERKELQLRNHWSKQPPSTVASVITIPNAVNGMP